MSAAQKAILPTLPPIFNPTPRPFPWPWPDPVPAHENGERSPEEISAVVAEGPELLKRLYFRPDYQAVIKQYTKVMLKQLERDPEAQKALQELLDQQIQGERLLPVLIAIAAGAALGYWAESRHH